MDEQNLKVDFDVVSDTAGHQPNRQVPMVDAVNQIFGKVKEHAMQCAVNGSFIEFETVSDLQNKLAEAVKYGYSVRVHDENQGG